MSTNELVDKIWRLCDLLRDDGITYHEYVNELSYILFLKLAKEMDTESQIPKAHRWDTLMAKPDSEQLDAYRQTLAQLGTSSSKLVKAIFAHASTGIKKPIIFATLLKEIGKLDWYSEDGLGAIYEGLLEKNAEDKKAGAGQYFTPRPLIDSIVDLMKPTIDDVIQDPAAGTGGFLVAANRYIRTHGKPERWTEEQQKKYRRGTFHGMENVEDTHRLALMNLLLHGMDATPNGAGIRYGDTLSADGATLPKATLILTNPPFGSKNGGGPPSRTDLPFLTANKQFAFLQHVYLGLQPGGRAAVVVPDNVLFENGVGKQLRADLMGRCNLHTILRLPTGIFYAQGVKTNVLFFARGDKEEGNTKEVWVYDLRANMPRFGKRTTLERDHFKKEFEAVFGTDPLGRPKALAKRKDLGPTGRFRRFTREWIASRNENLDIAWMKDDEVAGRDSITEPEEIADEILARLRSAMKEMELLKAALGGLT